MIQGRRTSDDLVLGVDGGGTKTLAWLATRDATDDVSPIGRGEAGPSNPQAVGLEQAGQSITQAVQAAFQAAGREPAPVSSACLALAGVGREPIRHAVLRWCHEEQLADHIQVVHDAQAVLAAGTDHCWGIALITGTGSFAFGTSPDGTWKRTGGWGYLFGDEGSGYAIGLAALRAISQAADRRGPDTQLTSQILDHCDLHQPADLIPLFCRPNPPRQQIASLARFVFLAADQGDPVANGIIEQSASDLSNLVATLAADLTWSSEEAPSEKWPLAIAGSVLIRQPALQRTIVDQLHARHCPPASVRTVPEPVVGAVRLARRSLGAHQDD